MSKLLKVLKRIKIKNLIILILMLSFSSYAWMIYVTRVSTGITAHVTSWNFDFVLEGDSTETDIIFDVEQIYPGMPDYVKSVKVRNNGEMSGELTYEIKKVIILGTPYEVSDSLTSQDLEDMLKTQFPFKIEMQVENSQNNVIAKDEIKNVDFTLVWPLDSGNDELDTKWGEDAYDYYKTNPDGACVHIELTLKIHQSLSG